MSDAYSPKLSSFIISQLEQDAIDAALKTDAPWDHDSVTLRPYKETLISLKKRIREFHLIRHNQTCCYCSKNFHGEFSYVIDREHILPKGDFSTLSYAIGNLAAACKRCNMKIKKADVSFVIDIETILEDYENPQRYQIIHPNFDKFSDHIEKTEVIFSKEKKLVRYNVKNESEKGISHRKYFEFSELEVNNFDVAQGGSESSQEFAELVTVLAQRFAQ